MSTVKRPYQDVASAIKSLVLAYGYKIGDRLLPEREIAVKLEVSRTVVREALIMLELEKVVEVRQGSGIYIVSLPGSHANKLVMAEYSAGPFELLQARQLLESNIAEFAATQATPSDIQKMRKALALELDDLRNSGEEFGDKAFHLAIAEATHNSLLVELFNQSWAWRDNNPMWQALHQRISSNDYRQEWLKDHQGILAAMIKKDPQLARKMMWQHLENVKLRLQELSEVDDPAFDGFLFESYPMIIN